MSYNIPRQVKLGGQTIKVKIVQNIPKEGCTGLYRCYSNEIFVQTQVNGNEIAVEQVEQTFWHEYAHALLDHARQEELCDNEPFIDLIGELLYMSIGKSVKWR
jgi:hypothetical protein